MSSPLRHATLIMLAGACWGCRLEPAPGPLPQVLTQEPIVRPLAVPALHAYQLDLGAGDYAEVTVEQLGVDVAVIVRDPASHVLFEIDNPTGGEGTERVYLVADQSGRYQIEVVAGYGTAGEYRLTLAARRPAGETDRRRAAAAATFAAADSLRRQGDEASLDRALEIYPEALARWREAGEDVWPAVTLERMAIVQQSRRRWEAAAASFEAALLALEPVDGEAGYRGNLYRALGQARYRQRDWARAAAAYGRAVEIARAIDDRSLEAQAVNNLAVVRQLEGRFQDAVDLYYGALILWRELEDHRREAVTLYNLGEILTTLGQHRRALELFQSALEAKRRLGEDPTRTLAGLAKTQRRLGDLTASRETYLEALEPARAAGDQRGIAEVLQGLGQTQAHLGAFEDAEESFRRAGETFHELGDAYSAAVVELNFGWLYELWNRPAPAAGRFATAFEQLRAADDRVGQASALYGLARGDARQGRLADAQRRIEQALGLIESLRGDAGVPSLKASFLDRRYDYYVFLVDLLARRHEAEPWAGFDRRALEAAERARARSALDLLEASSMENRLAEQELRHRQRVVQREIDLGDDVTALAPLRQELARLELRLQGHEERPSPPPLVSVEQMRDLLREDPPGDTTAFLLFTLGEDRSFLWWLTSEGLEIHTLPRRADVESLAEEAHAALSTVPGDAVRRLTLAKLSRVLLGPIAGHLRRRRLIVVPDGALNYLPFAVLPDPTEPERPLVARHEIGRLTSASVLAMIRERRERRGPAASTLAIVADPVFDRHDPRLPDPASSGPAALETPATRAASSMGLDRLTRLPATGAEAAALSALTPPGDSLVALGFDASRDLVTSGRLASYRIVHFATHGWIREDRPDSSGLVFSLLDRQGRPVDGLLRLHEIYDLRLAADLVVLSACRTALGRHLRGEGLSGLTQAFQYAGAASVLVSLWDVDDRATAALMESFYRALLVEGLAPAAALRTAQLDTAAGVWADPYYWAGFVLVGDWR